MEDLRPLARLASLRRLTLRFEKPWPNVEGLETLAELEELDWEGNLLPLESIAEFKSLRVARLSTKKDGLPLRDATRLPDMPALERLALNPINRMDGLRRFAYLSNLELGGCFEDLSELTRLPGLTHLSLTLARPVDLTPLAQLPELRRLELVTEYPLDLYALTDAPKLHEVVAKGCEANHRSSSWFAWNPTKSRHSFGPADS